MDKTILSELKASYSNLIELDASLLQDGRFSATIQGIAVDCLFYRKNTNRLFVVLHGQRNPEITSLPVFQRWSWNDMFPGSVLYISDPTLACDPEHMHIGWYLGTQTNDVMLVVEKLVRQIAKSLGILTSNVIAYGSSGGGFASIVLASRLGDATAVAINPQVNVLKYSWTYVRHMLERCFNCNSIVDIPDAERQKMDAIHAITQSTQAKYLYVQNVKDISHFNRHYLPFCKALQVPYRGGFGLNNRVMTLLYDDPNGHGGESKEVASILIDLAISLAANDQIEALKAALGNAMETLMPSQIRVTQSSDGLTEAINRNYLLIPDELVDFVSDNNPSYRNGIQKELLVAFVRKALSVLADDIHKSQEEVLNVQALGRFRSLPILQNLNTTINSSKRFVFRRNLMTNEGNEHNKLERTTSDDRDDSD